MTYRSDLEAARARVEQLEDELRTLREDQAHERAQKSKPPASSKAPRGQDSKRAPETSRPATTATPRYVPFWQARLLGAAAAAGLVLFAALIAWAIRWPPPAYVMQAVGLFPAVPMVYGGAMRWANPNIVDRVNDPNQGLMEITRPREFSRNFALVGVALYLVMLAISALY